MKLATACVAVVLASIASGAAATPSYFNKAGVERGSFADDVATCEGLAGGVDVRRTTTYSANPYAAGVGGLLSGIMASKQRRAIVESVLRTCMANKGYRRIAATPDLRRELSRLDDTARLERLHAMAAAEVNEGVLPR